MARSFGSSTMRAAVVLQTLLVVLLAAPLPVVAAPEGELTWTVYASWMPTGELAFLSGAGARPERHGLGSTGIMSSTALHAPLETRK